MATLFNLTAEQKRLRDMLDSTLNEETGEVDNEIYEQLKAVDMDRDEKIDGWCFWLKEEKAAIEAMKKVLDSMTAKYQSRKNAFDKAKDFFTEMMDGEKFKSDFNNIYYIHNTSVQLDDDKEVTDIDDDYLKYSAPVLDRQKIRAALKLGIKIPGVHLDEIETMIIR